MKNKIVIGLLVLAVIIGISLTKIKKEKSTANNANPTLPEVVESRDAEKKPEIKIEPEPKLSADIRKASAPEELTLPPIDPMLSEAERANAIKEQEEALTFSQKKAEEFNLNQIKLRKEMMERHSKLDTKSKSIKDELDSIREKNKAQFTPPPAPSARVAPTNNTSNNIKLPEPPSIPAPQPPTYP